MTSMTPMTGATAFSILDSPGDGEMVADWWTT
jgi:hypothetical protein